MTGHNLSQQPQWGEPGYQPPGYPAVTYQTPPPKDRKPIWKRWWAWALAALVLFTIVGSLSPAPEETVSDPGPGVTATAPARKAASPTRTEAPATTEPEPKYTMAQEQAIESAKSYLDFSGFSRKGLIHQLSSDAGEGFSRKDATIAVDSLKVNWKEQAVRSAKSYLNFSSFSRQGLIEQLSSDAGEGYTRAEAEYAADKVGF